MVNSSHYHYHFCLPCLGHCAPSEPCPSCTDRAGRHLPASGHLRKHLLLSKQSRFTIECPIGPSSTMT
ncbi:hypothetical protein CDAR_603921, partial [Caerostris darwini]